MPSSLPTVEPSGEPSSSPTLGPTFSSTVEFLYQQNLLDISLDDFWSDDGCREVFSQTVVFFLNTTSPSTVNITDSFISSSNEISLQYSVPFFYVGYHDKFIDVADEINEAFISNVRDGNFTSVLNRNSLAAGVPFLNNASSDKVIIIDLDHIYNSYFPTAEPTILSDNELKFYELRWFRMSAVALILCITSIIVFCLGCYWNRGVNLARARLKRLFAGNKVDIIDDDLSSDSESESRRVSIFL